MNIFIKTIEHYEQEYPTVGNYWIDENGDMQIRVSNMNNETYEAMISIHEFIEFVLLRNRGVGADEITKFDLLFEQRIKNGLVSKNAQPGFAQDSPYLKEHTLAESVEMQMCALAGINWDKYNEKIASLFEVAYTGSDDKKTIAKL